VVRDKIGRPAGELGLSMSVECDIFPVSALTLLVGRQEGNPACKKLDIGLFVVMIWLELWTTYSSSSPVVTTTIIILCFNKHRLTQVRLENGHQNGERLWFHFQFHFASVFCSKSGARKHRSAIIHHSATETTTTFASVQVSKSLENSTSAYSWD